MSTAVRERFVEVVRDGIISLPQDLKAVLRMVDDPEFDDDSRVAAAGALLHVLSASNAIPGLRGLLAYIDDVLVLRLVIERMAERSPEAMARHREQSPELLGPLEEQLAATREYLGDLTSVLEKAADGVAKLSHEGKTARQCVTDSEMGTWLYDEIQTAIVDMDFDPEVVARTMKSVDQILPQLRVHVAGRAS